MHCALVSLTGQSHTCTCVVSTQVNLFTSMSWLHLHSSRGPRDKNDVGYINIYVFFTNKRLTLLAIVALVLIFVIMIRYC